MNIKYILKKTIPDKLFISIQYYRYFGKFPNLRHPKTFNEKLQWLKLYDRNPEYTTMVDKYAAKKWVADRIGEEYIIPILGVWERFDDIDFDQLPNQFVLKCSHDSGSVVIVKDKSHMDKLAVKNKLESSLERNYYWIGREWPYKKVQPRIIAEKYITNNLAQMVEYKFFTFNGVVKMILVCKGEAHNSSRTNDYCNLRLERFPFTSLNPNSIGELEKPEELSQMIAMAEQLSRNITQLRVDFYLNNKNIYFGELTFYHNAGFCKFEPEIWDKKLGDWIQLPNL